MNPWRMRIALYLVNGKDSGPGRNRVKSNGSGRSGRPVGGGLP